MQNNNLITSQPQSSNQEQSQSNTKPLQKTMSPEEFKKLSSKEQAELTHLAMIEALQNPTNHGKTK